MGRHLFLTEKRVIPVGRHEIKLLILRPLERRNEKVPGVLWVHGGGWNAGSPKFFDFVGQCIAGAGYPFVSLGYRLAPRNKYPCQLEDVCAGYKAALAFLRRKFLSRLHRLDSLCARIDAWYAEDEEQG